MKSLFSTISFIMILCSLSAQDYTFWADAMVNSDKPEHRVEASQHFSTALEAELKRDQSFEKEFTELEWISIQYPDDRSFRVISWQVDQGDGDYKYYGYYQDMARLIPFDTQSGEEGLDEDTDLSISDWSGALVYRILQVDENYMLWTFRFTDTYTKIKTCEPLVISTEDVTIGQKIFQEEEGSPNYKHRHVLLYSADTNATLDFYDDSKRILFDNLIVMQGRMVGQGMTFVADGSYRGYDYNNGKWIAKDKLFDEVLERAPRANLQSGGKDLFGRKG
jgi:hypothetical protein